MYGWSSAIKRTATLKTDNAIARFFVRAIGSRLDKAQRESQSSSRNPMERPNLWSARNCPRFSCCLLLATVTVALSGVSLAQNEPILVPSVVDYTRLLPILPESPAGWTAEKPEGSTSDVGGFQITNVHRDYHKGEGKDAPLVSISILDSAANPDYVTATTAAWKISSETPEGYSKS